MGWASTADPLSNMQVSIVVQQIWNEKKLYSEIGVHESKKFLY